MSNLSSLSLRLIGCINISDDLLKKFTSELNLLTKLEKFSIKLHSTGKSKDILDGILTYIKGLTNMKFFKLTID